MTTQLAKEEKIKSESFYCPSCHSFQKRRYQWAKRVLSLYAIQVHPGKLKDFVECAACKARRKNAAFHKQLFDFNGKIESKYHTALKKVLVQTLAKCEEVDDSDFALAQTIYRNTTGFLSSLDQFRTAFAACKGKEEDLVHYLAELSINLAEQGKEVLFQAALDLVLGRGEHQLNEVRFLDRIAITLVMTKDQVEKIVTRALGWPQKCARRRKINSEPLPKKASHRPKRVY